MYKDRKETFPFRNYFLIVLTVLLFIFLLLFLFPTKWEVESKYKEKEFKDTFSDNIEEMKESAIGYFTTERMPQNIGESKKLTLQEMYDLNLVLKLKDHNGKECNPAESYVEMIKESSESKLKISLTCNAETAYVVVYLGTYNYCSDEFCGSNNSVIPATVIEETKTYIYK